MATNFEEILGVVGTLSTLYLILQMILPAIQNLYAEYGAIVFIGLYFLVRWLSKPSK